MGTITLTLPADRMSRLYELAMRYGVTPEDIVRIGFESLLRHPEEQITRLLEEMRCTDPNIFRRLA